MAEIQESLLDFLDDQSNVEENFDHLKNLLESKKIGDDQHKLKSFLYLLVNISNNHHRFTLFFTKIDRILIYFKSNIKKNYSNTEIFEIFKSNKRILLFLIEEEMMIMDENIATKITTKEKYITAKYPQYFSPEIRPFINKQYEITDQDFFYENRKNGENQSLICQLIQNDSVEEFITFVNRYNYYINSKIEQSIYETNSFLLKNHEEQMNEYLYCKQPKSNNETTLIEYAAFCGSIQIFQYLRMNNASLNKSLWLYAIHGQNAEIIHFLEEDNITPKDQTYKTILIESIKCHHNDITEYIQNKYLLNEEIVYEGEILEKIIKTYNFNFIQNIKLGQENLGYLCKYDYFILVDNLLKNSKIDINKKNYYYNSNKKINGFKTALFLAVEKENIEIVKLLLSNKKIDVNVLNKIKHIKNDICKEETVLYLAYEKRNIDIFKLLLASDNIDINIYNTIKYKHKDSETTLLFDAVGDRNVEIVKLLLTNEKIDINILNKSDDYYSEETALFLAVKKNYPEIVKLLLTNTKIDVNCINKDDSDYKVKNTALFLACEQGKTEIVKLLLTNDNINVNAPYKMTNSIEKYIKTPLHISVEKCHVDIVKLLLTRPDIDVNIKSIFKSIINVNCMKKEIQEETALHISLNMINHEIIKLLISRKDVDVNIKSYSYVLKENKIKEEEQTPFYISVGKGNIRSLKLLLTREDIDINSASICKYSKKNISYFSQLSIIPSINIKTPLDLAIKNNDIDIVKFLLKQKNIKIISRNNEGKRLIDMTNNKKMKKILKNTCKIKVETQ